MSEFRLHAPYQPTGDQPEAIRELVEGFKEGNQFQTLLGVTGSGKTFTMANVIQQLQKPTLIIAHNKTLAAQLYSEFKEFFPENAVEYFVSYYDYYQPEAYVPSTDTYIEKDSAINEEIDRLRLSATAALAERDDVIIISSVSCIYGLGDPVDYRDMVVSLRPGMEKDRDEVLKKLIDMQYTRNEMDFKRGTFRVNGDVVEVIPANYEDRAVRIEFFGDEIDRITEVDVLTGEIIDHFGGQEDLKKGVLRHVNPHTFAEDPLRVLRAAQFAARFSFSIAPETIELSQTMDLTTLAHERVMSELEKALLKAAHPSIFFEQMNKMNQLDDWFLHLTQLIGVKQPKKYHPEGDVWNHTMQVLDSAALLRSKAENPLGFMLTAVVHDFGKIISTTEENGEIHSYDHAKKGDPLVKEFLERITNETKLIRYVRNLASLHMKPYELAREQAGKKATNQMFDSATVPSDLILFSTADQMGKGKGQIIPEYEDFLKERLDWYQYTMAQPCVMGADLIKAGLKPGPKFSEILAYSHDLHLSNVPKEEALAQTLAFAQRLA